jgi:hypothetical protein
VAQFDPLISRLGRIADTLEGTSLRASMDRVGVMAKGELRGSATDTVGGDLKFSGWPRGGKLSSGYEHTGPGQITVNPRPYGLWVVADRGRRGAVAPKRKTRVTMRTPWGPRTFTRANPMRIGSARGHRTLTTGRDTSRRRHRAYCSTPSTAHGGRHGSERTHLHHRRRGH